MPRRKDRHLDTLAPAQLDLPLFGELRAWTVHIPGKRGMAVRFALAPCGVRIEGAQPPDLPLSLEIDVQGPARLASRGLLLDDISLVDANEAEASLSAHS